MDAHIPFNAARYGDAFGVTDQRATGDHGLKWRINAGRVPYGPRLRQQQNAAYDAAVRYADDAVRALVGMLAERGLLEQTLLVVTSDHGEGLGAHPELGHSISTWEEQLAVPLLVRNPHGRHAGEVSTGLTSLAALTPTVLDELGVARPQVLEDRPDLYHADRAQISADYRSYFSELLRKKNTDMARRYPRLAARIRHTHVLYCDPYKLSVDASGRVRFFDLGRDPDEALDLAEAGAEPRRACEATYRQLLRDGRYTPFAEPVSPEEQRRMDEAVDPELLRSLGYIE
jgi:arylsulfatase A-like enzyme